MLNSDPFAALDQVLESSEPAAALDFLIEHFRNTQDYGLLFEARLMKKRHELGLPLIQSENIGSDEYQAAVTEAAREAGRLFLSAGDIERAWPYLRAVGETGPIEEAIERFEARENMDGVIAIAFQEGVHPAKGLELILTQHGMCRAITAFGMTAVAKDRERCIALLARSLHAEAVRRMSAAIEAVEETQLVNSSLPDLMAGRDWLFGEWDYYVDTSHLLSVLPYCTEVRDPAVLEVFRQLCAYGRRLAPQFHTAGPAPFEDQLTAYGHYAEALLGFDVDEHVEYFRQKAAGADRERDGDAAARALVRLLTALHRHSEALQVLLDAVEEDNPWGTPVPSALALCREAKDMERMREIARARGDLLSYAAGSLGALAPELS